MKLPAASISASLASFLSVPLKWNEETGVSLALHGQANHLAFLAYQNTFHERPGLALIVSLGKSGRFANGAEKSLAEFLWNEFFGPAGVSSARFIRREYSGKWDEILLSANRGEPSVSLAPLGDRSDRAVADLAREAGLGFLLDGFPVCARTVDDVLDERRLQIAAGDWNDADEPLAPGTLSFAGASYALNAATQIHPAGATSLAKSLARPKCWPWPASEWSPKTPRQDLVRAAALILAEIERMDRAGSAPRKGL